MCGLVGIVSTISQSQRAWLAIGRDAMCHRGPDDADEWWSNDGRAGLAHRRLSILDLSLAGHQPMHDAIGELSIVFNGEIYNFAELREQLIAKGHAFRSHSDTEVLLVAYREWGVECLLRLNGMFAFALYDARQQTVLLARDRAGEKPLFYALSKGVLRFASELKGLMADPAMPRRIDAESLDCYLTMGYVPGERCIVDGVRKLPPAHALLFEVNTGAIRLWHYWQLPVMPTGAVQDELLLLDDFEALLEDTVRRQLVADVPVGVLLSGGVDSSLITAMAVRTSSQVKTFTVGFGDFGKYDESEHARLIAQFFGTEHIELNAGEATPDLLPLLARQYDEPMADSSMIPTYLLSHLVRQHCTVALGGDGADELFGGYAHYDRLLWKQQKVDWIPMALSRLAAYTAGAMLPVGFKGRYWLQSLSCDLNSGLPLIATFFDGDARRSLLGNSAWPLVGEHILGLCAPIANDLLQRITRQDFANYLAEDILVKVDRASMLSSLELRAPFLDYRIIEFAFGRVPSSMKTSINQRKIFLKKLTAKLLPPEFDRQRKQGFSVPLAQWLKGGPWRDFFRDILLDEQCIFDKTTVTKLFHGQDQGRNNNERLFSLVLFELWLREYGVTF